MKKEPRWSYDVFKSKKRLFWLMVVIFSFIGFLLLRLIYLQIWCGTQFAKDAQRQLAYSNNQGNPRGHILDRNGEELAVSIMCESLYVDPSQIVRMEKKEGGDGNLARFVAELLSPILQMDEENIYEKCSQNTSFTWIKRTLNPDESRQVRKIIKKYNLKGLHFIPESKRFYTKKKIAAQVLGFVGTDDKGGSGLELSLDRELRGAVSMQKIYYDARGGELISDLNNIKDTVPTVYLTLDMKMQYTLERAIDEAMQETKALGAAAILMDPHTGEILAMVSRPTFDPNHYDEYQDTDWQNKCIGYNYEPGSVFKPIVGAAALQCRVVTPETKMQDKGYFRDKENEINIENWNKKGRGEVTFNEVIKYSINTCMAEVGLKLGENNLVGFTEAFGFGKTTGIELEGEEEGILHDRKNMYKADVAVMSLGQGIEVTPLQMLRAICAIANGGDLLRPYIVKKIVAPNGEVTREGKKEIIGKPISRDVASQMRKMMEQVVESGGGQAASIKGYRIAGKTGTAQKLTKKGDYIDTKHIASFVGFVPANDPQYAMLVMLDEPQGKDFYGAQVASPVFRNTLQQILAAKGVQPQVGDELKSLKEFEQYIVKRKIPKLKIEADGRLRVPDFMGADMRACTEAMQGKLKLKHNGNGIAYQQSPPPNTLVPEDEIVEIWFK